MASAVSHDMPQDFVLNTAQMRDALHMQKFRVRSDMFDADQIVHASAAREIRTQKMTRNVVPSAPTSAAPAARHLGQLRRLAALQESSRSVSASSG